MVRGFSVYMFYAGLLHVLSEPEYSFPQSGPTHYLSHDSGFSFSRLRRSWNCSMLSRATVPSC